MDQFPGIKMLLYTDGILSTILMILSIRAGIALWSIKPDAVKTAKNYLLIFLGYSVISIFLPFMAGLPPDVNDAMIPEVVKGGLQSLVFLGYGIPIFNVSKRVKATYPNYLVEDDSGTISSESEESDKSNEQEIK